MDASNPKDLNLNRLQESDRSFHDWYRFILSFPPHLVRTYIDKFGLTANSTLLDPFCGTGTTIVEAKKQGIPAVGVEATPMSWFASRTKTTWTADPDQVRGAAERICYLLSRDITPKNTTHLKKLAPEAQSLLLKNSIGDLPLHKCLVLRDAIDAERNPQLRPLLQLALAHTSVHTASNLRFAPEVGISRQRKQDAPVLTAWHQQVLAMAVDLGGIDCPPPTVCHHQDARDLTRVIQPESIDAVITSPPYPNEKDYTRTTRLESVLLGFLQDPSDLKAYKQSLLRSNTRNAFAADRDDLWVANTPQVTQLAATIERRRLEMDKDSGFEKLYHRVTALYFGGMKRHFANLRPILKPGAQLAYVVGDQASFLQVLIRTGELLAAIAEELGYEVRGVELFRTRLSSVTGEQLREEVVWLEWPGYEQLSSR
ncbi:DNA methyltransferase [Acaryochloris sp. 'Moss Beach']|uniref:DNA methyltransferase n=1 Tax=Acaryochloris TaxID=155977 RepID=UPI001BAF3900|nr:MULTISPECIES: DNA methyltransferase [Acaryochloris]QUY40941.1 DNA methyltransferase [Acaryochloris marina S15]UJB70109.1 DNA methyltransferase [Acaryochloris sp. 'Moss Beach']